jgi:hypothetical protein
VAGISVGKRQYHAFLSHAHVDKDRADKLVGWLRDVVGAPVWYDSFSLSPGATIEEVLPAAIENSRSMILLLSKAAISRGWVQQEYRAAINHQTQHRAFRLIPIRLDDVDPPGFLQNYSYITLGNDDIDAASAAAVLKGLYQPATSIDPVNGRNVYVSRGWHLDDVGLAEMVCIALEEAGLQLIGDAEDQPSWVESRIVHIMEGCGAFTAVLPYRPLSSHRTSRYILREWEIAVTRGLPCLVIADPRVDLPPDVAGRPGLLQMRSGEMADAGRLAEAAAALAEDWATPNRSPYVFYATDFETESKPIRGLVKDLVEAVTTLPCVVGEYVKRQPVQREILRAVAQATFVLADISGDSPNVYIEIGAARAAETPVFLLRHGPPGRPIFMLRDQQVWDYRTDADLLGRITQIAYPYRRTLVSPERL